MLSQLEKNAGFKILEFFLFNPKTEVHLKELAKKLKMSPSTVKHYCDSFLKENLINEIKKGNLRIFYLNLSVYTKELKKALALLYFKEKGMEEICRADVTFVIYGSYASGEFDEKSDLDILVIADKKDVNTDFVLKFEKKINKQIQITAIPYYRWEKMKKNKENFANEVLSNHILIRGSRL